AAGSPAINFAGGCGLTVDERGIGRSDGLCDAGAFEFTPPPVPNPPGPPPSPPSKAPTIASATQSHSAWREGRKLASLSRASKKKPPLGTTFSFTLDQQASVSFAFTQQVGGRSVNGKCIAQTRRNRHRHACKRVLTRGVLTVASHAGANKLAFQGLISQSKKLPLGRYTLLITATNAAGQRSPARSLRFTIVK
ncbi:MAG TPA: choice-of-anchor Q domain-containing protein, partial [Solirubrobacteraceae bacterium]|nr:choice-of-anchor Q domain-containing protein [Solirubrobacteraceae bacterium]